MNMMTETSSHLAYFLVIFAVSVVMGVREKRLSILNLTNASSAMGTTCYIAADIATRGPSPFLLFALIDVFTFYLPLAFVTCLVCRALLGRSLYLFRDAPGE